ncbi:MAG TPA: hypothetical protein VNO54_07735 [Streptosporangiaceae bacterium]|nr:hypothetical protein [Streptosporangiaceae bacterium]
MSDNAKLAHTGGIAIVIGGTAITGGWLLAIAAGLVLTGALCIRFGFRPGKKASEQ